MTKITLFNKITDLLSRIVGIFWGEMRCISSLILLVFLLGGLSKNHKKRLFVGPNVRFQI